jgi:NAD(P)-dependent dehydrogenase (short-subunit alcohol dehydrogenase family)
MEHALIFGATGGIGSSVVKRLKIKSFSTFLSARTETSLASLAAQTESGCFAADVTDESQVEKAFLECQKFGQISAVALCVGSILLKPAHMTSAQDWHDTLSKNLTSAFYVVKYAAKNMGAGSVLLFSSGAAQIGLANHEAIAAAKAGVEGLVRSAAATYASRNLRFNAIAPGLIRTNLSAKLLSNPAGEKASLALHGLNRLGQPEDIADIAAWLLSAESSWVTGQIFNVDGGLTAIKKSI